MHPSERQRLIEHQITTDEMLDSVKRAESESTFLNLVKRSVILHGRRSVAFIDIPGGGSDSIEIDLQSHSFSVEIPRQAFLDPVGLADMLRIFQAERLKA